MSKSAEDVLAYVITMAGSINQTDRNDAAVIVQKANHNWYVQRTISDGDLLILRWWYRSCLHKMELMPDEFGTALIEGYRIRAMRIDDLIDRRKATTLTTTRRKAPNGAGRQQQ